MPHSPYSPVVYPPIDDRTLEEYGETITRLKVRQDEVEWDDVATDEILQIAKTLHDHVYFLDGKIAQNVSWQDV